MSTPAPHLRGLLLTTLGVLILTPDSLVVRLLSVDAWTLLFWRGVLQCVAIVGFYLVYYRRTALTELAAIGRVGIVIAGLYAGSSIFFILSIRATFVANTLVIVAAAPLLGALFSWLFLKEHVRLRTWLATLFGLLGIGVIFSGGGGQAGSSLGELYALGTAACLAGTFVVIRSARSVNMIPTVALSGLFIALCAIPWATPLPLGNQDLVLLLLLGMIIAPISFALITLGPRTLTAPEVALIMLLETVLAPILVWAVLGETPPSGTWLGGGIVFGTLVAHALLGLREVQRIKVE